MKKYIFLITLMITSIGFAQEFQEKYQRAKIHLTQNNSLETLLKLGLPVDHGIHKKGYFVISEFSVSELNIARTAGFNVEILIEDYKTYFQKQNKQRKKKTSSQVNNCQTTGNDYKTPENFNLGSMGGYFTYQEALDELDKMNNLYPNLITAKENISTFLTEGYPDDSTTPSIGGNGIKWVKISDNPNITSEGEPQILYTALHHAREPNSLSQLIFYMWYLLENYDNDPEIKSIVNNTELYFVPVVNPDGYLYNQKTDPDGGGLWRKNRKNEYGTDPNRNYDYYINGDPNNSVWGGDGSSDDTNSLIYHGSSPFSDVESQAIKWFVENHNFTIALNNHSAGNLMLYPYSYSESALTPEDNLYKVISDELVSKNGFLNIVSSDLYTSAGTCTDFMYGTVNTHNKIYSFTPEIGEEFWPPSSEIIPIAKNMMYMNLTAAKMIDNYAAITPDDGLFIGNELMQNASFEVERLGITGSGNFVVKLIPLSNNISSVSNEESFLSMNLMEIRSGSIPYSIKEGTNIGDAVTYQIVLNNGTYETKTIVNKKFGDPEILFKEDGNTFIENFITDGWSLTTNTFVSSSSSITDSPDGDYGIFDNKTITTKNKIDLSNASDASISFFAKWEIEEIWDFVQVAISIDNGTNWEPLCGNYTKIGNDQIGYQPNGEPLYSGTQNDWVFEEIDLVDYLGESILIRFQLITDGYLPKDGFYFDDLKVNVINNKELSTIDIQPERLFSLYPTNVDHTLKVNTASLSYEIEIFNLQGQLIFSRENNMNNTTVDFSTFSSGIYLMNIISGDTRQTFKLVKK